MQKKISVIITEHKEHAYLIRCLNSIRRQTYQNIEIILTGTGYPKDITQEYPAVVMAENARSKEGGWKNIFEKAGGDYIYFCSETSVLAPNVLEDLFQHIGGNAVCMAARCMVPNGNDFKDCANAEATAYGKILKKELFWEKLKTSVADGTCRLHELEAAVLEYVNLFSGLEYAESAFVYETDESALELHLPPLLQEEAQNEWLAKIKIYSSETKNALIGMWISDEMQRNGTGQAAAAIMRVARVLNLEKEINYEIAHRYVKQWYEKAVEQEQESFYRMARDYLGCFDTQEAYQRVLLYACGIGREQYAYMKKSSLEEYLFYKDKLMDEQNFLCRIEEMEALKKGLEDSRNEIDVLKKKVSAVIAGEGVEGNVPEAVWDDEIRLKGPALAEYVIDKYRQGWLGLRTIVKSFMAWAGYKL